MIKTSLNCVYKIYDLGSDVTDDRLSDETAADQLHPGPAATPDIHVSHNMHDGEFLCQHRPKGNPCDATPAAQTSCCC